MFGVGIICQQGSHYELGRTPGRLVMFFFLLFLLFLYISYSANIVGLLQSTSDSIKTIKDVTDSNLDLVAEDALYIRHYTKVSLVFDVFDLPCLLTMMITVLV